MKAIVQRVTKASVTVGDELISSIGKGLYVLVGISRYDTPKEMEYIVRKVVNLRVFKDDSGKRWSKNVMDKQVRKVVNLRVFEDDSGKLWSKNVMDKQYEILCVSQFTLCATLKGNKPDYHDAMGPELSQQMYQEFIRQLGAAYNPDMIKDGKFGAYMQVNIQNDGPVTIPLECVPSSPNDTKNSEKKGRGQTQGSQGKSDTGVNPGKSDTGASPVQPEQAVPSDTT